MSTATRRADLVTEDGEPSGIKWSGRGSLRGQLAFEPDWDSETVNESIAAEFGIFTYTRDECLKEFVHPDDQAAVLDAREKRALLWAEN